MAKKAITKAELQAALDAANAKIEKLETEAQRLRPLESVVEAQKNVIKAQQEALSAINIIKEMVEMLKEKTEKPATVAVGEQTTLFGSQSVSENTDLAPADGYTIYCDGACIGNGSYDAPGGWGTIILDSENRVVKELSGGCKGTTNNRMELTAAISGLKLLPVGSRVTLVSDSQYLINGLQKGWAKGWRSNGWTKSDGKPALNPALWEELLNLTSKLKMSYQWVKGHAGNPLNERCDQLAVREAQRLA